MFTVYQILDRKSGIEIVRVEDLCPEAFSLHNETYSGARTPSDWIWEYKCCFPSLSVFTVVRDRGRIVGTQGMLPIYLSIGGKKHLTGKSENTLLEKSYRGRGLFRDLYSHAITACKERGMCCVWGFTSAPAATSALRNKLGFSIYDKVIQTYGLLLAPTLPPEIKRLKRSGLVYATLQAVALVSYLYCFVCRRLLSPKRDMTHDKFVIEEKIRSADDIGELYERLRLQHPDMIHITQDAPYIAWRITNNPNIKYRTYLLFEGKLLRAYCYLNVDKERVARLTDFTAEDKTSAAVLAGYVINVLSAQKVGFLLFMGNMRNPLIHDIVHLLKRYGFLKLPVLKTNFVLNNLSCEEPLYDVSKWYMNGLWTEGYQW